MDPGTALAVIAGAILINVVVMAAIVVPPLFGWQSPLTSGKAADPLALNLEELDPGVLIGGLAGQPSGQPPTYDRTVRVVSWVFLLTTAVIVGASGLWPSAASQIFILLGLAGAFVLIVHDILPATALGAARPILEGTVALTFATFLVLLTGGHTSPFFFTFPLIVGAAALVVRPTATLLLAVGAAVGYIAAASVGSGQPAPTQVATMAVNLTALLLLAYVGSMIGREQRRTRDAAIRLSAVDPLTGLFNRTFWFAALWVLIAGLLIVTVIGLPLAWLLAVVVPARRGSLGHRIAANGRGESERSIDGNRNRLSNTDASRGHCDIPSDPRSV